LRSQKGRKPRQSREKKVERIAAKRERTIGEWDLRFWLEPEEVGNLSNPLLA
jgi:hypothetical protein